MTRIGLADNNITSEIPKEFGDLKYLKYLILCGNDLNGEIPKELCKLKDTICHINLENNPKITGQIPIDETFNLFKNNPKRFIQITS